MRDALLCIGVALGQTWSFREIARTVSKCRLDDDSSSERDIGTECDLFGQVGLPFDFEIAGK